MIITISGKTGSGERSTGRILARRLKIPHHSGGRFLRNIAERKEIPMHEFAKMALYDTSIDAELDMMIADHGKTKDNFILDSKMGFHFIPHSVKIFLDADFKTRVFRRFRSDMRKEMTTKEKVAEKLRQINEYDKKRFSRKYNVDFTDPKNYDLIIDNTNMSLEETADKIIEFLKKKKYI